MNRYRNDEDPIRRQFAAETRDYHLDKMRRSLGMPVKARDGSQDVAQPPQPPAATPTCTCDDQGECDVCKDWARRMLELARGKQ